MIPNAHDVMANLGPLITNAVLVKQASYKQTTCSLFLLVVPTTHAASPAVAHLVASQQRVHARLPRNAQRPWTTPPLCGSAPLGSAPPKPHIKTWRGQNYVGSERRQRGMPQLLPGPYPGWGPHPKTTHTQ